MLWVSLELQGVPRTRTAERSSTGCPPNQRERLWSLKNSRHFFVHLKLKIWFWKQKSVFNYLNFNLLNKTKLSKSEEHSSYFRYLKRTKAGDHILEISRVRTGILFQEFHLGWRINAAKSIFNCHSDREKPFIYIRNKK